MEDDKNVENFVDCREIRTVFKPTWVSWWFHKIFTFPRVECDEILSNCHWGRDKALVRDGGTVTVGFSYRIFHDTKIRCKSSPIEVSPSHAELEAKTAIRECLMVCVWEPNPHKEMNQNDYYGETRSG
ncbi:hypothetical protein, partial [Corynebacterium sp. KPL1859]|uniref:hypothetical protein n=1 Tax=Corynebacterium sp. KPL1859 TaxID=1203566 RepID=UPI001E44CF42